MMVNSGSSLQEKLEPSLRIDFFNGQDSSQFFFLSSGFWILIHRVLTVSDLLFKDKKTVENHFGENLCPVRRKIIPCVTLRPQECYFDPVYRDWFPGFLFNAYPFRFNLLEPLFGCLALRIKKGCLTFWWAAPVL
ncbi:hypothetical protein [uncultured Akkermansia sp.]|jgi:hypothetical protein|uniref:hypothetical protein n=1 Tax=uncultured Akkermansia sp. TaxID=512294 RepID=UPI0025E41710|nr:hypothetical protein [uncultured Akkermansia sp.]